MWQWDDGGSIPVSMPTNLHESVESVDSPDTGSKDEYVNGFLDEGRSMKAECNHKKHEQGNMRDIERFVGHPPQEEGGGQNYQERAAGNWPHYLILLLHYSENIILGQRNEVGDTVEHGTKNCAIAGCLVKNIQTFIRASSQECKRSIL